MLAFWITLVVQGGTLFGIIYIYYSSSQNSQEKMKYLIYLTVFSMLLIMILFETEPFGLKKTLSDISGGHGGDWLQFWGTYLGIIFSVILTLYVTQQQGEIDRKNARSIHAIEIYIDNLMISLDIFNELSEFFHRCENYGQKKKTINKKNNEFDYDIDLILLLSNFEKDGILDKIVRLENAIKKMPFKVKQETDKKIEDLKVTSALFKNNDYLSMYDDKAEMNEHAVRHLEEKKKQIDVAINKFTEAADFLNRFVISELDEYNKI